jgi:membrane associated rhomboid family serine protease
MTWFLGVELERIWGSKKFLIYYIGSGVGASILYIVAIITWHALFGGSEGLITPVIGASGSVFGLMMAYGILFGDRVMHFMMLFPMKAKTFVLILGGVEVLSVISHGISGSGVANLAHLGGLVSGYILLVLMAKFKNKTVKTKNQRKSGLRLVVDNEKEDENKTRYWN